MSYETYRAFLHIVCKHLGMNDPTDAIDDFFSRDPNNKKLIADLLSETSLTGHESYAQCFGVGFYKVTVNDRRVFRIPVNFGTTVLRKPQNPLQTSKGSQKSHSDSTNYTVLGVVDHGITHRASAPTDTDRVNTPKTLSVRESLVSSHGMTLTTASCETETGPGYGQQMHYMVVSRMYPRECLFAAPLNLLCKSDELDENKAYFYAIRSNTGASTPRIKYQNDPMQLFPVNVSVGYLQGSLLECAHRLFSMVFMRLLAYFNQRKDLFTRPDGEVSVKTAMTGKVSWADGGGAQLSPQQNALGHMTRDESGQSTDDTTTHRSKAAHPGRAAVYSGGSTEESQRLRDEFSVTLFKFGSVLEETIHALQGVFNLQEPDFIPDEDYVIDPSRDYLMLPHVTKLLKVWDQQIDAVMELLNPSRSTECGPLDEVDYWRHRCKVLTAIAEALRSKKSQWVINAWAVLNPEAPPYNRGAEIKAQMLEAKDNSRFLLLVERHFKNVQFGSTFEIVTDTIPAMVQSLRLIWTISRGYNKDERMGPLLQRIAWALCDRVICVLEVSHLFSQSIRTILREVRAAIRMLTTFENTYLLERQRVEATSQDNRWEFDRKSLFGDIHYMKRILTDIYDMAKCANEFYHMFGPELKNITGDNKTLSEILRLVDQLFTAMKSQELPCPFLQKNEKMWLKVKAEFEDNASMIDAKAKNFINDYFAHIRGPTSAFDLLEKFKSVKARAAITCLLKDKYRDVLRSFGNELVKVESKFKESRDAPAVAHYLPPTAGSISWSRLILLTVKASILRFIQSQPDILEEDEGKAVKARYISLAEELRKYERGRHRSWEAEVNATVSLRLSQPVLFKHTNQIPYDQTVQAIYPPPTWWAGAKGETGTVLTAPAPPQAQLIKQPAIEQTPVAGNTRRNSSVFLQRNHGSGMSWTSQGERTSLGTGPQIQEGCLPVYEVNFDSRLWSVVQEAARMELFGLALPEIGRFLGLRYTYYQNVVLQLQRMVDRYEAIRVQLDPLKVRLMETGLRSLVNTIDRGVFYLNWDSLVIDEYLEFCDRKLKRVETHIKEIHRCSDILERIGVLISRTQMFKEKDGGQLVSAKEYMDYAEAQRESDMEELASQIGTMATSCLGKLEEVLFDTNTCRRAEMYPIYQRFELMILLKLLEMVLRNMWSFVNALGGRQPIFYIDVLLVNSDVVLYPVSADLYKWMMQTLRGCVESCRYFIRWKHGTCEPCPTIRSDGDELVSFNYVTELERCPELREPDAAFNQRVQHLNRNVMEFLKRLARFSVLWHQDKQNVVEKWLHLRTQTTKDFELRIIFLRNRWQNLDRLLGPKRIIYVGAIALRLSSFFMSVTQNLRDWIRIYMRYLYDSAENFYNTAQKMILAKRKVLRKRPTSLVEMKELLSVMAEIRGGACEVIDDHLMKVAERLRIIRLYGDQVR
ncbi:Dynein heavy chain 10, axonemal [Clonorchis sinensis]|uniref:Dynein heavy chain 10, axonemal n=1 Tax=Clonorchis sinensis TaxID=79923 RepID=A0A419PG81_CLOSI|nr:Dynein heavy chain 10, axonemal [Clonorchis sinensis]